MRVRADPDPKHRLHLKLCTNASMAPDNQKLIPEKKTLSYHFAKITPICSTYKYYLQA